MRLELPPSLAPLAFAWVAVLGAVVGSFLNVVIARVPRGESIAWPGSRCPRCHAPIRWYDNLPIVSWLVLRARCRACRAPISIRYPLVEALGAGAALVAFGRHGLSGAAAAELAFAAALLALAFIDLDTWLLPHVLTWSLLAFGILMGPVGVTPATTLRYAVYGAGIGFAAFALVSVVGEKVMKKEALGFGDVWLLAGLGAWFGPLPLLPIVLLASVQGSIVGVALIVMGKGQPGPAAPTPTADPSALSVASPEATRSRRAATSTPTPHPDPLPAARGEGDGTPGPLRTRGEGEETPGSTDTLGSDEDWIPPKNAVPFGPFLVAGALEWLWLGDLLARWVPALRLFR